MIEITKLGTAFHKRTIDSEGLQKDTIEVKVPLSLLTEEAQNILDYWCVEDFNSAEIDWFEDEICLRYKTFHYLPEGYIPKGYVDIDDIED